MPRPVPVIAGAGQITDRPDDPRAGLEPLALMVAATRRACEDATAGAAVLQAVDTVAVVTNVFHDYGDTAAMLAARLGLHPQRTILSTWGGNTPQALVTELCNEIAAGRSEVALIAGGEACATMRALGKAGIPSPWTPPSATAAPRWGDLKPGTTDLEARLGMREAYVTFALYENAFRAARTQSLAAQRTELGVFGARCAAVAAANPYAWFRDAKDADTLMTVTAANRMVAFPYPKYLNAIMDVNQGAALLLLSEAAARRAGIPEARWVWPSAAIDVAERWFLSERATFHELPVLRRAAAALLEHAGHGAGDIAAMDLYACFPIAPRLTAAMLGFDPTATRPLTVTGGLPWFGGPGNNYTTHAIAAVVERLRAARDAPALIHGIGWHFTKHALGIYAGHPPAGGWHALDGAAIERGADTSAPSVVAPEPSGPGRLETYTVVHDRDGAPARGVAVGRLDDGRRFVAVLPKDRALLESCERAEQVGRLGTLHTRDGVATFHPGSERRAPDA